ncbi:S8 family serine peptidase [Micromonospora sp. M12]
MRDGDTYVYPDAALSYVTGGLLDRELFNVTELVADGYDDAHTDRLPLIVTLTEAAARNRTRPAVDGAELVRPLDSVRGAALTRQRATADRFWTALTGGSTRRAGDTPPWPTASPRSGWTVGCTPTWPSPPRRSARRSCGPRATRPPVSTWRCSTRGRTPNTRTSSARSPSPAASCPRSPTSSTTRGTVRVASSIAGTGAASGGVERVSPGRPAAHRQVLNSEGSGQNSWIIAGMEWAAREQKARVVSMSLGGEATDGSDPMSQAVERLSAETGALFVIAAGNGGRTASAAPVPPTPRSPWAPSTPPTTSPTSPARVHAPATAGSSRDHRAGRGHPGRPLHYVRGGSGDYTLMSGTSMATRTSPVRPRWSPPRTRTGPVSGSRRHWSARSRPLLATPVPGGRRPGGRGRRRARHRLRHPERLLRLPGLAAAAGDDRRPDGHLHNVGSAVVTLRLALDAATAPAGLFALSTDTVTVPANGTATVTVTAAYDKLPVEKQVSGMIVATDDAGTVRGRTLVGAGKEGQRQNLTLVAKDRDGKPLAGKVILTTDGLFTAVDLPESGTATLRLPVASWTGWISADVRGAHGPRSRAWRCSASPTSTWTGTAPSPWTRVPPDRCRPGCRRRPPPARCEWTSTGPRRTVSPRARCCPTTRTTACGRCRRAVRSPTASSSSVPGGGWSSRR